MWKILCLIFAVSAIAQAAPASSTPQSVDIQNILAQVRQTLIVLSDNVYNMLEVIARGINSYNSIVAQWTHSSPPPPVGTDLKNCTTRERNNFLNLFNYTLNGIDKCYSGSNNDTEALVRNVIATATNLNNVSSDLFTKLRACMEKVNYEPLRVVQCILADQQKIISQGRYFYEKINTLLTSGNKVFRTLLDNTNGCARPILENFRNKSMVIGSDYLGCLYK